MIHEKSKRLLRGHELTLKICYKRGDFDFGPFLCCLAIYSLCLAPFCLAPINHHNDSPQRLIMCHK